MIRKLPEKIKFRPWIIISLLLFFYSRAGIAWAQTFDIPANDSNLLISSIITANNNSEADTINLANNSSYVLHTPNNNTYKETGLPVISSEIIINGNGSKISRNSISKFRLSAIKSPGLLILNDLEMDNGYCPDDQSYGGGAIFNLDGQLILENVVISNNIALTGGGGGVWIGSGATANIKNSVFLENSVIGPSSGGALLIRTNGVVSIHKSIFNNNYAENNGGALYSNSQGSINFTESNISNNSAKNHGGAIYNISGNITINGSEVSNNQATYTGPIYGFGGAIANEPLGNITITNSKFSNNVATKTGGFLWNKGTANITNTCVAGNSSISLYATQLVNAINNYWGAVDGPSGIGPGSGDSISSNVSFLPFLTACNFGQTEERPLVLLPGLGGSWNTLAMIGADNSGTWKKTPFVKVYDNLKNTFIDNAGFEEGINYFEFYYDWRQTLDQLADEFKNYLENIVLLEKPATTKVDLLGHSMGGMVSRAYVQKYGSDKINKIVTVGSPHEGALPAWFGWDGGEVGDRWSWQWIALQIYLNTHKLKYSSPVAAVRGLAPGLKDLLPIFDFARDNQDQIISVSSMDSFNTVLDSLKNSLTQDLKNIFTTISGLENNLDRDTIEWVKLTERSMIDRLLHRWPNGKPQEYFYTSDGDLTVLQKSALISGATPATVSATHVELVETPEGIQAILDAFGLNSVTPATGISSPERNPSLVFWLHSPAEMTIFDSNGQVVSDEFYFPEDKLWLVTNAQTGTYQVNIQGTGEGNYQLDIGQLSENGEFWETIENYITSGESDSYQIYFDPQNPLENPIVNLSREDYLDMAKSRLFRLKNEVEQSNMTSSKKNRANREIDKIIDLVDQNQIQKSVAETYSLRSLANEAYFKNELNEIGELLISAFLMEPPAISERLSERELKAAEASFGRLEKRITAKVSSENQELGAVFSLSGEFLTQAKAAVASINYSEAYIKAVVSQILTKEAEKLI